MLRRLCNDLRELPIRTLPPVSLGCTRPEGHSGKHMVSLLWDDDGHWSTDQASAALEVVRPGFEQRAAG